MYLLTFTFLVIGMLGIYTQVAAVEAQRFYQGQTSIGQAMIAWHEAAVGLAENVVNPTSFTGTGCSLTATLTSIFTPCSMGTHVTSSAVVPGNPVWLISGISYTFNSATYPSSLYFTLHNTSVYTWNSIAFNAGGSNYVMTYVTNPGAGAFVSTAALGGTLAITQSDLYQQVKQSGTSPFAYGYVPTLGTLNTSISLSTGPVSYTIPTSVPAGSFGIISEIVACNGC